ncbi:hypothetical protein [Sphingomonas sp.]|uniref:hypothetical protein n=1 Tax=Sphingomonas sp. TaxID=28214 RepID=UPI0025CC0B88|nr:hypothetical protein [Sphingomonas sp.]
MRRLKNGLSVEQPIAGDELRAIRRYLAMRDDHLPWPFAAITSACFCSSVHIRRRSTPDIIAT